MPAITPKVPPVGTKGFPTRSTNTVPKAAAQPQPPSLVALPPRPSRISVQPLFTAWEMICPTPYVEADSGSLRSPTMGRPAAAAISITASGPFRA